MPAKCRSCDATAIYYTEGRSYNCQVEPVRRCDLVDDRLAELAFRDRGQPSPIPTLLEIANRIQEAHGHIKNKIETGSYTFPSSPESLVALLESLHSGVFSVSGLSYAGRIRTEPVVVGNGKNEFEGSPPDRIREHLHELYNGMFSVDLSTCGEQTFLRFCARFLEEILRIHPFSDGNGRIARLCLNVFAKQSTRFLFKAFSTEKKSVDEYVAALEFGHRHAVQTMPGDERGRSRDPFQPLVKWLSKHLDREPIGATSEEVKPAWIPDV